MTEALRPAREDDPGGGSRWKPTSMVEYYLGISRHLGCPDTGGRMDVPVTEAARSAVLGRLEAAGIDQTVRPESLPPEAFVRLAIAAEAAG